MADVFVLADDYQYTTNHQINRTKIKTDTGWSWLTLPVLTRGYSGQLINQVKLNNHYNWPEKHIRTLNVNYTYAAYFEQYIDRIESILLAKNEFLIELNQKLLYYFIEELNLSTKIVMSSDLNLKQKSDMKLLEMLEKTNCKGYLADFGLRDYLAKEKFENEGFFLEFIKPGINKYHQMFGEFIPNLSIVDLLFNEGNESHDFISLESQNER